MKQELGALEALDNGSYDDLFRQYIEEICRMAIEAGVTMTAGNQRGWDQYRSLPSQMKLEVLNHAKVYHQICSETTKEGRPISDSKALLWWSLKNFGLVPCSDMFDKVDDNLVVEVYSPQGIQLFRNLRFMDFCSYTLSEIFAFPWWDLFVRNDKMLADVQQEAGRVLSGAVNKTVRCSLPNHRIVESFSEAKLIFDFQFLWMSPLFDRTSRQVAGLVCISKAETLGSQVDIGLEKTTAKKNPELSIVGYSD